MNRRAFLSALSSVAIVGSVERAVAQSQVVPPEFVALGVQEDGRWVSPQFGVEVTWESPYEMDYTPGGSVFSDMYGDTFNIHLPETNGIYNVSINGPASSFYKTFDDSVESVRNYEAVHDPVTLLFSETEDLVGGLVVIEWGNDIAGKDIANQVFLLQSFPAKHDSSVIIKTRIDARYDAIEEYVDALDRHVTVDGEPALRAFTLDEVKLALKKLPKERG